MEDFEIWYFIVNLLSNIPGSDISDALHKVACGTKNMMNKKEIVLDTMFIAALHKVWVFSHFKFLQGGDEFVVNTPGYL